MNATQKLNSNFERLDIDPFSWCLPNFTACAVFITCVRLEIFQLFKTMDALLWCDAQGGIWCTLCFTL